MSDPSFSDTLSFAQEQNRNKTAVERDWWNRSSSVEKRRILGQLNHNDIGIYTASENAYQRDTMAKLDQLGNENYDSLPDTVKTIITETLIESGVLPNPSDFKGIGQEFEVKGSLDREVFVECDRCDEVFMAEEDFDLHKDVDHGDDTKLDEEAEESLAYSMNPETDRFAMHEARKVIAETKEEDLHRKNYFNGDALDFPTLSEPDGTGDDAGGNTIAGTQGYDPNPNEGLYDNKEFTTGDAKQRSSVENIFTATPSTEADNYPQKDKNDDWDDDFKEIKADYEHTGNEADNYPQKDKNDDWDDDFKELKSDYEDRDTPVSYENSGVSDISEVEGKDEDEDIPDFLKADISEEAIDFGFFPTKAVEGKQKSYLTEAEAEIQDEYSEFGTEDSEEEQVTETITERKMAGYSPETIANEIRIMYGVSPTDAMTKVNSVEVSINDRVANTFFQKPYSQCNESERQELALYSGNDEL